VRRSFLLVALCAILSGCAKTVWQDATGAGRGTPDFQMDSANCQLYAQANTPQTDTSQCQGNQAKTCAIAGTLSNVLAQAMTFNLCMQGRGWQQVKVTEVAQAPQPPERPTFSRQETAESDDDDADDDNSKDPDPVMLDALVNEAKTFERSGDYAMAIHLYRRAARYGDAAAENNLGSLYANGNGVPESREKALYWLRRAEEDADDDSPDSRVIHANLKHVRSGNYTNQHPSRPLHRAQNSRRAGEVPATAPKKKAEATKPHPATNQ